MNLDLPEKEVAQDLVASKPNILIENRLRFKNDIHAHRLFLGMLQKANQGVDITKPFEIDASVATGGIFDGGETYKAMKRACHNVMGEVVDLLDGGTTKDFSLRCVVITADYREMKGNGKLKVQFHPDLVPYILKMFQKGGGEYTRIFLKHAMPIRSVYSVRIYEFLLQYKNFKSRDIEIEELKSVLDVPENKFKRWNQIKENILIPAQKHLEEYTDIRFDFTTHCRGRKVEGVHFIVFENTPKYNPSSEQLNLFESTPSVKNKLQDNPPRHVSIVNNNIWPESQKDVLENYSSDRIEYYYDYCKKIEQRGGLENFKGFFYKTLIDDRDGYEVKKNERIKMEALKKQEEEDRKRRDKEDQKKFHEAEQKFNVLPIEEQQKRMDEIKFLKGDAKRIAAITKFGNI